MNHAIWCNLCKGRAHFGVNRVRNFILFHFCSSCTRQRREECDQFMRDHAPDLPIKKEAGRKREGPSNLTSAPRVIRNGSAPTPALPDERVRNYATAGARA
jgi:hypothetical protein